MTTRRRFLESSGVLAAAVALGGCEQVPGIPSLWSDQPETAFAPPNSSAIDGASHVLARLSYGARPGERNRVRALGDAEQDAIAQYINQQLAWGRHDDRGDRAVRRLETLVEPAGELYEYQPALLRDQLGTATLLRAVYGDRQLFEVMVGFWTDHFNIDISKGDCRWLTPAYDRDVIRPHALGRFPELLRAVVLSPAMLWYLDGRVNRRATASELPNENYARELLELHTLGVHGGYTQTDVMEVARALTGWVVRSKGLSGFGIGAVEFHAELHDDAPKTVLGHVIPAGRGIREVDDVLAIVANHPACARFVAAKLCRRFIADDPPAAAVDAVARTFSATNGDVSAVLRTLFSTSEFNAARGVRFKRPFHFVASALRATDAQVVDGKPLMSWLERMGHSPYQYPTPDGYPDEATPWLGTLLWRWQFASALASNRIEGTHVNARDLVRRAGSDDGVFAHLIGRAPTVEERELARTSGNSLALALSSPAFQWT